MKTNMNNLYDGDTFEHDGLTFIIGIENDLDTEAPWVHSDCHGPVSEWTNRDKKPGEIVLHSDGYQKRFYDVAEAQKIALRDKWGIAPERMAEIEASTGRKLTAKQIAALAVENDFKYLRGWCNDDWRYVGICVRHVSQDELTQYNYACWGVESLDPEHMGDIATECATECARAIKAEIQAEREALKTQRTTFSNLAMELRNSGKLGETICTVIREKLAAIVQARHASMARIAELSA